MGRTVDSVVTVEEARRGAKAAEVRMVEAVVMVAGVGKGYGEGGGKEVGRAAVAKVAVARAAVVTVAAAMAAAVMEEERVEVVKGAAEVTGTGAAVEMAGAEATVAAEAVNPVEMREGRRGAETVAAEEGMVAAGTEATAAVGIAADCGCRLDVSRTSSQLWPLVGVGRALADLHQLRHEPGAIDLLPAAAILRKMTGSPSASSEEYVPSSCSLVRSTVPPRRNS